MKTRTLTAAGLLALAVGSAANAAMIVNTETTDAGTRSDLATFENGTSIHLVQRVNFEQAFDLTSIQVNATGDNFNLYLSRAIGEGARDADDIMWSVNGASSDQNGFSWMSFDAEGVTVGAGEYYLVMTSDIEDGGRWREVLNTTEGTFGVGGYGQASFEKNDGFSIIEQDFSESTGRWIYGVRIEGEEAIPAPGAAALFGLAGLTAARRRR